MAELPICITLSTETESSLAAGGVEEEVIAFFDLYRSRILRYVLSFGLAVHDGEDVVQEVFLALFQHLQMGRSRSNLRSWVFRVAHNLALKRRMGIQKPGALVELDEALLESCRDPEPDPEEHLSFRQRQGRLLAVVHALPENDERCLRLRAEGLTYREIAEVLEVSLGLVSVMLTRSLARLRRADCG